MSRLLFALLLMVSVGARAGVAVLTQHNDLSRTGANLQEALLNTGNVGGTNFGLVFSRAVDDQIYAQPLVMTNVTIPGKGVHNVVYVCTVNDTVYAFDADIASVGAPLWSTNLIPAGEGIIQNVDMTGACGGGYVDFSGKMGLVSTPVIDPATGTIYLVARTRSTGDPDNATYYQRLHALDLATGAERASSPVLITATVPGTGYDNSGNVITFSPRNNNQRAGLALVNGLVYITWSSHCDWDYYHGWVMGYDKTTLQQAVVYNTSPNGSKAGIWMSGQAPAADANGNLYLSTGNGSVGSGGNPRKTDNRGESFLKLTRTNSSTANLTVSSWFTPYNYSQLNSFDQDLGSTGVLLIPGTNLLFSGGKEGVVYVVNRDSMGGLSASGSDNNIVQSWQLTSDQFHTGPVWWDGPGASYLYVAASSDYVRQFQFDRVAGQFVLPSVAQGPEQISGVTGAFLALSANGSTAGSGILWVSTPVGNANNAVVPGTLRAYDASNVANELWNSDQNSARDGIGNFAKFVAPTVANGKVYMATFSGQLNVYGLLSLPKSGLAIVTQPSATAAPGVPFLTQPVVQIIDTNGSPVADGVAVTAMASTGTLQGTATALTAGGTGTAAFTDLALTNLGNLTLTFHSGSLSATSSVISVVAGNATRLIWFVSPPASSPVNTPFNPQPVIKTADQSGYPTTNGLGATQIITVSLAGAGSLGGVTNYDIGLAGTNGPNGTVTCVNLSVNAAGNTNTLTVQPGNGLLPASLPGISLWVDPSAPGAVTADAGGNVTGVTDLSGAGNTFTVSGTTGNITTNSTINGRRVLTFPANQVSTGKTLMCATYANTGSNALTFFHILRHSGTALAAWEGSFGFSDSAGPDYSSSDSFDVDDGNATSTTSVTWRLQHASVPIVANAINIGTGANLLEVEYGGGTGTLYWNGAVLASQTTNFMFGLTRFNLGGRLDGTGGLAPGNTTWNGDLAEQICCNTALTAAQRQSVETYLTNKWMPVLTSGATTAAFAVTQPPVLLYPAYAGGNFGVSVPSTSGHTYVLQYKNLLSDATWLSLTGVPGTGGNLVLTNANPGTGKRFYRVKVN